MRNYLNNRLKILEDKSCSLDFVEKMEDIFSEKNYDLLTSKDVEKLKEYLPDKFELLLNECYKQTSASI